MEQGRKYWVPAIEKAHAVIRLIGTSSGDIDSVIYVKRLELVKARCFPSSIQWIA